MNLVVMANLSSGPDRIYSPALAPYDAIVTKATGNSGPNGRCKGRT